MKLSTLIKAIDVEDATGVDPNSDPEVTAVCYDSREVGPGAVFVAIAGFATDGHRFIDDALAQGAAAVVCERPVAVDRPVFRVRHPRAALARMAARFYGYPADALTLIGVTGTSGKTTVTYLLEHILANAGLSPGVVGTVNYRHGNKVCGNPVTTPESADLQRILKEMADDGVTHVVMEVSSHALDLNRVDGCRFDLAVFTNLTHDHLDYHGSMDRYWESKRRLFGDYLKDADPDRPLRAVVNRNDSRGRELAAALGSAVLGTDVAGKGDIVPRQVVRDLAGLRGTIATPEGDISFDSSLVGDFNLENILSAAGAALALGIKPSAIAAGIASCRCVPGRLERVPGGGERHIFVDYSHKPDALENAIGTLRALTPGRVITVFGCGGDRDRTKRPVMGEIAARLSDLTVVTSDNPRSEDPLTIIDQVEVGVRKRHPNKLDPDDLHQGWQSGAYLVQPDRRAAIEVAIGAAGETDTVLIAGKGHETYQILAGGTVHFDDREVAREILAAMAQKGK